MSMKRPLPGVRFELRAPRPKEVLPRMDVAVFAGFAASGPINEPVAVEDIARFEEIFGPDLVLAAGNRKGETLRAYLAPAVRAFFRNGGKRCWIIRVTQCEVNRMRDTRAHTHQFQIPGLLELLPGGGLRPARAMARSAGSWAGGLRVSTNLVATSIPLLRFQGTPDLVISPRSRDEVRPGDLLRIRGAMPAMWVEVAELSPVDWPLGPVTGSGGAWRGRAGRTFEQVDAVPPGSPPSLAPVAEKITFDLRVRDGQQRQWRLPQLGFAPDHPRYWAALAGDQDMFRADYTPSRLHAALIEQASVPRFPLTGGGQSLYLPLHMGTGDSGEATADSTGLTNLEEDGLESFASSCFLDPAIKSTLTGDLLNTADFLRYAIDPPIRLAGIHAALEIEEATLIAVPDAVHLGWDRSSEWMPASPPNSPPPLRPEWWSFLPCPQTKPVPRVSQRPGEGFLACDQPDTSAMLLTASAIAPDGEFTLSWGGTAGAENILEESRQPDFATLSEIYRGADSSRTVYGRKPGIYYYRVSRIAGNSHSDYSNTLLVMIPPATSWTERAVVSYDDTHLLAVHRALVRLCAARGDMVAVLPLPRHYRELETLAYPTRLTSPAIQGASDVPPLSTGEWNALSYSAVYHPWLTGREENMLDELRVTPPDGACAGILARRSLNRGAWIAPANEMLRGVVALEPSIRRATWQAMQDAQINLIRQEPQGFLYLSAETLSPESDLQPLNVRRLLILLRRLALKLGPQYVFEPNSPEFRRLVERGLEAVLEDLFRQGAFAGRTTDEAFQVVTDRSLNPPASVEQGRFITEIRVAPSLPLHFLTVRLLQTADRTSVTEGRA